MALGYEYLRDGAAIYQRSFAAIRAESDLARFSQDEARVAVRIIHACGTVEIASDLLFSETFTAAAREALLNGAPILCDSKMVANGITRARLPADNEIICRHIHAVVYNPDEWYDNRKDKKAGAPDFRHASTEDGNGRRIGLWLNGKAPTPSWVHTLLPFRDQPDILRAGQPF